MGSAIQDTSDLNNEHKAHCVEIIKEELLKSEFKDLFDTSDFDISNLKFKDRSLVEQASLGIFFQNLSPENAVWLDKIFSRVCRDRKQDFGRFYSFKKFERGIEIISNQTLKLFSLNDQSDNDFAELTEFYQRYTSVSELSDSFQANTNKQRRKEIFIFCFTKSFRNERFWKEYTPNESGLCIGFDFESFNKSNPTEPFHYEFRDVFYDNGYSFDFLNEIQSKVWRRLNVIYKIQPVYTTWFPFFYKRRKYIWEDESRISIDKSSFTKSEYKDGKNTSTELVKIRETPSKKMFIELPFKNDYFSISIREVIIGRNAPIDKINDLKELSNKMGFKLWQAV